MARTKAEVCLTLFREINNPEEIAFGQNCLANIHDASINDRELRYELALKSLSTYTATGNQFGIAESLKILSGLADYKNDFAKEHEYLEKCLAIYQQIEHLAGIADVYFWLGRMAGRQGDFEEAQGWIEKDLSIKEQFGLRGSIWSLEALATIKFYLGDYATARKHLERCISLSQQTGETGAELWATLRLGHLFLKIEELDKAINVLIQSLHKFAQKDEIISVVFALEGIASFAVIREQPETAVRLIAWADITRESIGDMRPPVEQADVERDIALILDMLDEEAYATAYAWGKGMTMEQAIALAMEVGGGQTTG